MQEIILKEKDRKEIIDGKIYDTETATKIAFRCNICSAYNAFLEILYRKKNGQFFLYTTGEINAYIAPLANEEAKKMVRRICFCRYLPRTFRKGYRVVSARVSSSQKTLYLSVFCFLFY